MIKNNLLSITSALTTTVLLSLTSSSFAAENEKCMGIAKAGMGDGQVTIDGKIEEWIYVPAGACEKFVEGRLLTDNK